MICWTNYDDVWFLLGKQRVLYVSHMFWLLSSVCLRAFSSYSGDVCAQMRYLQFLHGKLCAVLFGALHQDIQRVAVILPLGTQRLLPDGLLYAFLQGVSCTDTLQRRTKEFHISFISPHIFIMSFLKTWCQFYTILRSEPRSAPKHCCFLPFMFLCDAEDSYLYPNIDHMEKL